MDASIRPAQRAPTRRQRGISLLSVLLALIVSSLVAAATLNATRIDRKHAAGTTEATILDNLRAATNAAIYEQVVGLQAGNPLTKNGVTVAPAMVGGVLTWQPSVADLTGMGYLPPGWTRTTSSLNGAAYAVSFSRIPAGCVPASCSIEGQVLINGAINEGAPAGDFDSISIGPILTRMGADAGFSLPPTKANITGVGNTWSMPNPVAGTPAGVVAVRVGTASAGFSQFVRINDSRDPNLQGNLTVAGNLGIGGTSSFGGAVNINNSPLTFTDAAGNTCVQILSGGTVNINCTGALNSKTGKFSDGAGQTNIGPGTVSTTGAINAGAAITATDLITGSRLRPSASYMPGAACSDANALAGNAKVTGLVLCSGGIWRSINTQASAGTSCSPDGSFATEDGVALICKGGKWVPLSTFTLVGTGGAACSVAGATALDTATGGTLLCRANAGGGSMLWYRMQDMTGNMQFVNAVEATDSLVVTKPSCGRTGAYVGQPAIVVVPKSEGSADATFARYAIDNGGSWTVYLRDTSGGILAGTGAGGSAVAIAQTYCYYP